MKQIYTKLMALVAMFLLAGANAWAVSTWLAYVNHQTVSITITTSYADKFTANLQAKANTQITYSNASGSQNVHGLQVSGSNKLYLKPTTDGYLQVRLACASGSPLTVTIHDNTDNKDVESINVVTAVSTLTEIRGETVLFEVEPNHEYVLNASEGRTYYVTVVSKFESNEVVELNEEQTAAQVQSALNTGGDVVIVKMQRALTAGIWNTFSSPIKLGLNAMRAELKCNEAYELKAYNATDKTITFQKTDNIVAGKPYLIKPSEDVSLITVSNRSNPASYNPQTVTSNGLSFVAALGATNIYTTGDANSTKLFLNKNNKLVYPTSNEGNRGMIKGFRAYFEIPSGGLVKDFVFDDSDDPTGIIRVEQDIFNENGRIYSVDGRYVGNSKENLSRGIYVQNGRKFIVK